MSHMLCFSTTEMGTYLRLGKLPRGPTMHFRVDQYCLCKDVAASQRRPHSPGTEFLSPPLVVLNNMQSEDRHVKLTDIMVQNLFPAIDVDTAKLAQCRRVVLFRRDPETGDFDVRHYVVHIKVAGLTRGVRKIVRKKALPNLSKYQDISEYVTGGGGMSDSEPEDAEDSKVDIQAGQRAIEGIRGPRRSKEEEAAAVKLVEIGPRLRLQLLKIEEGFCEGEVLYHHHVSKSPEEIAKLREEMNRRKADKDARKRLQRENVEKKKHAEERKHGRGAGKEEEEEEEAHPLDYTGDHEHSESDDDAAYYRQQVGHDAEEGTFQTHKRKERGEDGREVKKKKTKVGEEGPTLQDELARRKNLRAKKEKRKAKLKARTKGKKK